MYFFFFDSWFGSDKVVAISSLAEECAVGDCVMIDGFYALALGNEVSFQELHNKKYGGPKQLSILYAGLLTERTVSFIHRFVAYRFTTYHNTIPLFLGSSIKQILDKAPTAKSKKKPKKAQQVVHVFPTLRALENALIKTKAREQDTILTLTGSSTIVQKAKAFRVIKLGTIEHVYITHSQIYHDRAGLTEIIVDSLHARQYKNHKDPRYYLPTVVEQISKEYECQYKFLGNVL